MSAFDRVFFGNDDPNAAFDDDFNAAFNDDDANNNNNNNNNDERNESNIFDDDDDHDVDENFDDAATNVERDDSSVDIAPTLPYVCFPANEPA